MGWSFGWQSRGELIQNLTRRQYGQVARYECIAKFASGNDLWMVIERTELATNATERYIALALLRKGSDGVWGYKDMDEACHPFYFSCPLKFLAMVPERSPDWREEVRRYWVYRRLPARIARGDVYERQATKGPRRFTITVVRARNASARGDDGQSYRLTAKQLHEWTKVAPEQLLLSAVA